MTQTPFNKTSQSPATEQTDNLRGVAWLLFSVVTASLMSITVRELAVHFDSRMIVMLRSGVTTVVLVVPILLIPAVRQHMRFSRPGLHIVRGVLIGISTHLGFYTLTQIPIATASVLFFTAPIFATVMAGPVHGEKVGPRRWSAVGLGFLGAVIILRPGLNGFHPAMLAALGSSLLFSIALTLSRNLARADGPLSTFFSSVVITALISLPLTGGSFSIPTSWGVVLLIAVLVITAASRNIGDLQAYRYAEAGLLAPITYLRLVILGISGYVLWGEIPDLPTIVGAGIIVVATLYIGQRELALRKAKKLPR